MQYVVLDTKKKVLYVIINIYFMLFYYTIAVSNSIFDLHSYLTFLHCITILPYFFCKFTEIVLTLFGLVVGFPYMNLFFFEIVFVQCLRLLTMLLYAIYFCAKIILIYFVFLLKKFSLKSQVINIQNIKNEHLLSIINFQNSLHYHK